MVDRKAAGTETNQPEQVEDRTGAPTPDIEVEKQEAPKPGVRHVSGATERRVSEEDWQKAGVAEQKTVVWDGVNGHFVPLDAFTPEALDVLKRDDSFEVND